MFRRLPQTNDGHRGKPAGGVPGVSQPVPPGLSQAPGDGQRRERSAAGLVLRPLHQANEAHGREALGGWWIQPVRALGNDNGCVFFKPPLGPETRTETISCLCNVCARRERPAGEKARD